jgi:hypothetical protein
VGSCEYGNEPSGSIKRRNILIVSISLLRRALLSFINLGMLNAATFSELFDKLKEKMNINKSWLV